MQWWCRSQVQAGPDHSEYYVRRPATNPAGRMRFPVGSIGFLMFIRLYLAHDDRALAAAALKNVEISWLSGSIVLYSTMWWCSTKLRWWLLLSFVLLCIMPLSIGLDRLHKIGHVLVFVDKGCFVTIRLCFTSVAHLIATALLSQPWNTLASRPRLSMSLAQLDIRFNEWRGTIEAEEVAVRDGEV